MLKFDEVKNNMLNTFNNNIEDDNDQNMISSFIDEDVLEDIEEDYNSDEVEKNNSKCLYKTDEEYTNIVSKLINRACEQDKSLNDKKSLETLYDRYNHKFIDKINFVDRIDNINIAFQLGYNDIVNEMYINFVDMIAVNFGIDCNHLNKFPKLNKIDENNVNRYIRPSLLYKFNNLKNKIKNNSLNKDINIKLKGKTYNFKSNKNIELKCKTEINNYINNINDFKKKYNSKYNKITDDDINEQEKIIKNNKIKNETFWKNYNEEKNKSMKNLEKVFKDDPIIKCNNFNEKYKNKTLGYIYKNIITEIDVLEREYNNIRIIETYYNKLKENTNINSVFKNSNNKINKLFTDYENNRINEYRVLLEIGDLIVNDKLSKQEKKEISSINQNSRPARLLKQANRIYTLKEFINLKNIALSGISNWLRDTSDDNFNILLSFFNKKNIIPDLEYFSDDDKPIENKRTTRLIIT